jgi:hypothetical protein
MYHLLVEKGEAMQGNTKIFLALCINIFAMTLMGKNNPYMFELKITKEYWNHSLVVNFLNQLKTALGAKSFVETGTFLGITTSHAAEVFEKVYTIELSEKLYQDAIEKLKVYPNVFCYLGDSGVVMPKLLPELSNDALFWLDAHWSGDFLGNPTARGDENTPIVAELKMIARSSITKSSILIDDLRYFDSGIIAYWDQWLGYPTLEKLLDCLYEINPNYSLAVIGDHLLAYIKNENFRFSETIEAMTVSRLYDGLNYDIEAVLKAEEVISRTKGEDKEYLLNLHSVFANDNGVHTHGMSNHYRLWHALISMGDKDYSLAYELISRMRYGKKLHWRIDFYAAQCAAQLGKIEETRKLLAEILQLQPSFNPAQELLSSLS